MKHFLLFIALYSTGNNAFCQATKWQIDSTGRLINHLAPVTGMDSTWYLHESATPDTLPAHLLVSRRPPSFGHSVEGYCITINGVCTGRHVVYRRKKFVELRAPYDVWRCIRKGGGQ